MPKPRFEHWTAEHKAEEKSMETGDQVRRSRQNGARPAPGSPSSSDGLPHEPQISAKSEPSASARGGGDATSAARTTGSSRRKPKDRRLGANDRGASVGSWVGIVANRVLDRVVARWSRTPTPTFDEWGSARRSPGRQRRR